MGFSLSQEPAFIKEYKKFVKALPKVSNPSYQHAINKNMEELKKLVAKIDVGHDADFNGMINPIDLRETRARIQEVRQEIIKLFMESNITIR